MARKLLGITLEKAPQVVVFDLEYTAWENSLINAWKDDGQDPEIIQIGAVEISLIDDRWTMTREFNQYIKPKSNPTLSEYIIELTGIRQKFLDENGIAFPQALALFQEFCREANFLCCNGTDAEVIQLNTEINCTENPFHNTQIVNVRRFLAEFFHLEEDCNELHSHNLPSLLNLLADDCEIQKRVGSHDALEDAHSIARALAYIYELLQSR